MSNALNEVFSNYNIKVGDLFTHHRWDDISEANEYSDYESTVLSFGDEWNTSINVQLTFSNGQAWLTMTLQSDDGSTSPRELACAEDIPFDVALALLGNVENPISSGGNEVMSYYTDAVRDAIANLKAHVDDRERWRELNWDHETDEPLCGCVTWDENTAYLNSDIADAATILVDALKKDMA